MRAEYGFSHAFTISLCRSGRNGRLTGAGRLCPERNRSSCLLQATSPFSCIHCRSNLTVACSITSNSSSYAGQTGWEGSEISSSSSSAHSCPWANRALPAGSEDVRDNTSSSSSSLSSAADGREIFIPPTAWSASSICDPHDLSLLAASGAAGPEPRGADDCPNSQWKKWGWCVPQAPFYARRRSLVCVIGVHLPMSGVLGVVIMLQVTGHAGGVPKATLGRGRSIEFLRKGSVFGTISQMENISLFIYCSVISSKNSDQIWN